MKSNLAVSIIGRDRPGIVAGISRALLQTGCNIEDSSMTLLRSEFAMILIVSVPSGVAVDRVVTKLEAAARALGLSCSVRRLKPAEHAVEKQSGAPWVLSVYGADKPGIVHAVSGLLARRRINITNVQTKVTGSAGRPAYCMFLEIFIPARMAIPPLKKALAGAAARLNITVNLNPADYTML